MKMADIPEHIAVKMAELEAQNQLRSLRLPIPGHVDLTSNDYLGLARRRGLETAALGSGGSRLLTGHHAVHAALEEECADLFEMESALLYSTGYMANVGLLSAIGGREGIFVHDELIHASLRDGLRLARGSVHRYRHQDYADLDRQLAELGPGCFVVTEALFSMDGDLLDLARLCAVTERHHAWLIVDEAHSTGLYGPKGAGWVLDQGYGNRVWMRIHTFGKSVGRHGAVVVGPQVVRDFLINRSRTVIYSTAMPPDQVVQIHWALREMQPMATERSHLLALRRHLEVRMNAIPEIAVPRSDSPIIPVIIPGNERVKSAAEALQASGFDVRPILAPTVARGTERLRIILHSYNTIEEVDRLVDALQTWQRQQGVLEFSGSN